MGKIVIEIGGLNPSDEEEVCRGIRVVTDTMTVKQRDAGGQPEITVRHTVRHYEQSEAAMMPVVAKMPERTLVVRVAMPTDIAIFPGYSVEVYERPDGTRYVEIWDGLHHALLYGGGL